MPLSPRVVCDFDADVTLDQAGPEEPRGMRVLVSDDRIVFGSDEVKRSIELDDVLAERIDKAIRDISGRRR